MLANPAVYLLHDCIRQLRSAGEISHNTLMIIMTISWSPPSTGRSALPCLLPSFLTWLTHLLSRISLSKLPHSLASLLFPPQFQQTILPRCGKLTIDLPWNLQTYLYLCLFSFFPLLLQKRRNLFSYLKVIFSHVLWILSLPTCLNRQEVEFNWHILVTFTSYSALHNWPLCPSRATLCP